MTTERLSVHRSQPIDWPLFAGLNLPDDVGVLFVENRRQALERMTAAVNTASSGLRAAVARSSVTDRLGLWLVMLGRPSEAKTRRQVLLMRRAGLWGGLETDEYERADLPDGTVPRLYLSAAALVADRTFPFAARASGLFDDVGVGPDLVARTPLLDRVEAGLHSVLADEAGRDH